MIGEWAWNPWQWGDVTPHRRGERDMSNEPKEKPSSLLNFAPSTSWKFLRPSLPSNQIQLPDLAKPKATSVATPPAIEIVDPSTDSASQSTGARSEDANHATVPAHDSSSDQTNVSNAVVRSESSSSEDKENTEVAMNMPALRLLELEHSQKQSPSNPPFTSQDVVGFYDTNTLAESHLIDEPQGQDGTVEAAADSRQSSDDNSQAWYPSMMDKKEYDFFDRRLNY